MFGGVESEATTSSRSTKPIAVKDHSRRRPPVQDGAVVKLVRDLTTACGAGRACFEADPTITGAQLYAYVRDLAEQDGWEFGNTHSGHLVGEFPHETIDGDKI